MAPTLDHVVIVVHDLEAASAGLAGHGFRLKAGRPHANGLLNRHVKFRDGSGIELMTVVGDPGDPLAAGYAELLRGGEGGVYVALRLPGLDAASRAASGLALPPLASRSGPWRFLGFPATSPAAAVFFVMGPGSPQDPDSVLAHEPPATGLAEVWTEGGAELGMLLERLGARRCGSASGPEGRTGTRWALRDGAVVVVPGRPGDRPRLLGAVLESEGGERDPVRVHERFWIRWR